MRALCLAQERNTVSPTRARTPTALLGAEYTNHTRPSRHHSVDNLQTNEINSLKCNNTAKKVYRIEDVLNHSQTEFAIHAEWHVIKQSAVLNAPKTKSTQLGVVMSP